MRLFEGAKSEMRASLSDNLLHRIEKKAVQDIYIHFSPTLLPRLREEEERLLRKWFARMANGSDDFFFFFLNFLNFI